MTPGADWGVVMRALQPVLRGRCGAAGGPL